MQWFNEPKDWSAEGDRLRLFVTPKTDYWRKTHYGFIVDDGPFYFSEVGGEFEAIVCIRGEYRSRYDQMGLMVRKDERNWIKAGVEFVDEKVKVSAVVTRDTSDWSILDPREQADRLWIKMVRRLDAVEISYSLDNKTFEMMRLAYFPDQCPVKIGLTAASPDGDGFEAAFEALTIRHLPDARRLQWLKSSGE